MMSSAVSKQWGWVLAVIGAIIGVPILFPIIAFIPVVMNPELAVAEGRFGGTADQAKLGMGFLLLLAAFGWSMILFGLQRGLTGRSNRLAIPVILLLAIAMFASMFYLGSQIPG